MKLIRPCWVCGKQYCLSCNGIVVSSYGFHDICKECETRKDVQSICDRYAKRVMPILIERNAKLKGLRKKSKKEPQR